MGLDGIAPIVSRTGWSTELGYELCLRNGSRADADIGTNPFHDPRKTLAVAWTLRWLPTPSPPAHARPSGEEHAA